MTATFAVSGLFHEILLMYAHLSWMLGCLCYRGVCPATSYMLPPCTG